MYNSRVICCLKHKCINNNNFITSVSDAIEFIFSLEKKLESSTEWKDLNFYRGQSNYDWILSPSLYRTDPKTNESLFNKEKVLIWEAMNMFPEEFEGLDKFSILVKLQHYGMKTRLLDLTENPLVALYFACNKNHDKDGAFYIFPKTRTFSPKNLLVKYFMEYIFEFSGSPMQAEKALKHYKRKFGSKYPLLGKNEIEEAKDIVKVLTTKKIVVIPKRNNPRLVAQKGAFCLFGMEVKGNDINIQTNTHEKENYSFAPITFVENDLVIGEDPFKLKIPKESKQNILKELDCLQINESTLFDDLEHKLKYIQEKVEREYNI